MKLRVVTSHSAFTRDLEDRNLAGAPSSGMLRFNPLPQFAGALQKIGPVLCAMVFPNEGEMGEQATPDIHEVRQSHFLEFE
jgi:hypothetical protein